MEGILVLQGEKSSEGDGGPTLWMCLMPLKNGQNGKFHYIFLLHEKKYLLFDSIYFT